MAEELINGVQRQYYEAIITRLSWWEVKKDGRKFVFIYIHHKWPADEDGILIPETVGMLEVGSTEVVERPWRLIVDLYIQGDFIKIS